MNKFKSLESKIRDIFRGLRTEASYVSMRTAIRQVAEAKKHRIETHALDQISAGTYQTKHFEMCPSAQKLYTNLPKSVDPMDAEEGAILQDKLFALEKAVLSKGRSSQQDVDTARQIVDRTLQVADRMGLRKQHDQYLQMHLGKIESHLKPDKMETGKMEKARFKHASYEPTIETPDMDIDNSKFKISRSIKGQRKLKIIDND